MSASLDERLRAAIAALAERAHLIDLRSRLTQDLASAERRVADLAIELRREQADVERLTTGVIGFLTELLGGTDLEREQREAYEADIRLREAVGNRDRLRAHLSELDQRIARPSRAELEAELAAARAAKEHELVERGAPTGIELQDLAIRIESIDIELVPLEAAVTAGTAARAAFAELLATIDVAIRAQASTDRADLLRTLAGTAQARETVFQRAIEQLATSELDPDTFRSLVTAEDRQPFLDPWLRQVLGRGERHARLAQARDAILARFERIDVQLGPVRDRHDQLAARRAALVTQRLQLLQGT